MSAPHLVGMRASSQILHSTGAICVDSHRTTARSRRPSGFWTTVLALSVLLLLLAIFILQNTRRVQISFLGWDGHAPLADALLIAGVAGALVVASAGAFRILQLRRRVKRERQS